MFLVFAFVICVHAFLGENFAHLKPFILATNAGTAERIEAYIVVILQK